MRRHVPTPKKAAFLAAYAATCTVTKAADAADINRATHYDWLQSDPEYKAQFEKVQEQAVQTLEDEAIRRAYHGTQRPVTVAGKRELVTEYSDTLLIFLLKGMRPQKYRDNVQIDVHAEIDLVGVLRQRFARQAEPPALEPPTVELEIIPAVGEASSNLAGSEERRAPRGRKIGR